MNTFGVIIIELKNGRKMYLKAGIGKSCEWTLDRNEAIWFETEKEAEEFAKSYFKNFRNWGITVINFDLEKIYQ